MDEVPVEEVEWLWYPYIPYGKLTIIHGDGGEGKTTLILRLAALLSRGEKLPCDDTEREHIKVIYQKRDKSKLNQTILVMMTSSTEIIRRDSKFSRT